MSDGVSWGGLWGGWGVMECDGVCWAVMGWAVMGWDGMGSDGI